MKKLPLLPERVVQFKSFCGFEAVDLSKIIPKLLDFKKEAQSIMKVAIFRIFVSFAFK